MRLDFFLANIVSVCSSFYFVFVLYAIRKSSLVVREDSGHGGLNGLCESNNTNNIYTVLLSSFLVGRT